jgi:hypothetical protein
VALAAWKATAAAERLPGQQLSAVTFDCGVAVEISRREDRASPAASPTASSDGAGSSAGSSAASSCYYVRVTIPADYGADSVLHWAVENWDMPPRDCQPPGSEEVRAAGGVRTHRVLCARAVRQHAVRTDGMVVVRCVLCLRTHTHRT